MHSAIRKHNIIALCNFFEEFYGKTTLIQIVKALVYCDEELILPSAIITFNADSLLYSLIQIFSIKKHNEKSTSYNLPKEKYKKVTWSSRNYANYIPIFHIHGTISPNPMTSKMNDSREKLIFLENSYNKISNNMYSWAQSTFLYYAQSSKLVFIGLSMSDPNIRKWLSWTTQLYNEELFEKDSGKTSLPHLWIKTKLKDNNSQEILDVSLRHMGVKIGLINSWEDIEKTLKEIM